MKANSANMHIILEKETKYPQSLNQISHFERLIEFRLFSKRRIYSRKLSAEIGYKIKNRESRWISTLYTRITTKSLVS